jgi:hypothetical protein
VIIYDDNFIDKTISDEVFKILNNSNNLNWTNIDSTNNINNYPKLKFDKRSIAEDPQSVHSASLHDQQFSFIYDIAKNLLDFFALKNNINVKKIIRVKSNIIEKSNNNESIHPPHIDMHIPHFVFLYYVNNSDGNTIIFNEKYSSKQLPELTVEKEITPKSGSAVIFNGLQYHSSSPPIKSDRRIVINVNFMGDINP